MTTSTGKRALSALLPLGLAGAALAGCSGSSTSASTSTSTSTTSMPASIAAARAAFISCLEAHGVPASVAQNGLRLLRPRGSAPASTSTTTPASGSSPTTAVNGSSATTSPYQAAFLACRSQLPAGGFNRLGGGFLNTAAGKAYLNCLEAHGVTIPSTPSGMAPQPGTFRDNPTFQAARQACAALAPTPGANGASPGSANATTTTTAAAAPAST